MMVYGAMVLRPALEHHSTDVNHQAVIPVREPVGVKDATKNMSVV